MRRVFFILMACCTPPLMGAAPSSPINVSSVSERHVDHSSIQGALAEIESGHLKNPDRAQGASGEVSRYQIMPKVWRSYSRSRDYSNPDVSWRVAREILKDRHEWFRECTGRSPSAFDLYVMWNKPGLYSRVGFNPKRLPRRLASTAGRFANLVEANLRIRETARVESDHEPASSRRDGADFIRSGVSLLARTQAN